MNSRAQEFENALQQITMKDVREVLQENPVELILEAADAVFEWDELVEYCVKRYTAQWADRFGWALKKGDKYIEKPTLENHLKTILLLIDEERMEAKAEAKGAACTQPESPGEQKGEK